MTDLQYAIAQQRTDINSLEKETQKKQIELVDKYYEGYSPEVRHTIRMLDTTHKQMVQELVDLDFVNTRIEEEDISQIDPMMRQLMKVRAEVELLRTKLSKSGKALTQHYDMPPEPDNMLDSLMNGSRLLLSSYDELAETGQTDDSGPVVQIIKGITTNNQRNEFPSWDDHYQEGSHHNNMF